MVSENPLDIANLPMADEGEDFVGELIRSIQDADEARRAWLDNCEKLTKQRLGMRTVRKTAPWPGASDIRVPTQDRAIRRWRPKILSLVFDADPIAYFRAQEPSDVVAARVSEAFYDWLFKVHMRDTFREMSYVADLVAHRGFGLVQVCWDYTTEDDTRVVDVARLWPNGVEEVPDDQIVRTLVMEYGCDPDEVPTGLLEDIRAGATRVTLKFETVVSDKPRIVALDPARVIVPAGTTDIGEAPFVCIQHLMDERTLRRRARDKRLDADRVEALLAEYERPAAQDGTGAAPAEDRRMAERDALDRNEGVDGTAEKPDKFEVWEVHTWSPCPECRRTTYWIHPKTQIVLASYPYALPFHRWNLVKFEHEVTNRRWYGSRGISRMLSPLARSINKMHNARLDAISILLAPMFTWRSASGPVPRSIQARPGAVIPVTDHSDFAQVANDLRGLQFYTAEEMQTRNMAEEYVGVFDASILNPQNPPERRTATEVSQIVESMQGSFSLDAKNFQLAMSEVHRMVWQLWMEFGPEAIFFRVQNQEMPFLFRKSEVPENFDITPAGTPANTSKALELARAREALQVFAADETGFVNKNELYKWYFDLLDWRLSQRVIAGPQAAAERQILMRAANELASGNFQAIMQQAATAQVAQAEGTAVPGAMPG